MFFTPAAALIHVCSREKKRRGCDGDKMCCVSRDGSGGLTKGVMRAGSNMLRSEQDSSGWTTRGFLKL